MHLKIELPEIIAQGLVTLSMSDNMKVEELASLIISNHIVGRIFNKKSDQRTCPKCGGNIIEGIPSHCSQCMFAVPSLNNA